MKIWKAELILSTTLVNKEVKQILDFSFEEMKENFEQNIKYDEYIYSEGWICTRVSKHMEYEKAFGNPKVIQGLDHELNEEELDKLKEDMKKFMIENLQYEKEMFNKNINEQINTIKLN